MMLQSMMASVPSADARSPIKKLICISFSGFDVASYHSATFDTAIISTTDCFDWMCKRELLNIEAYRSDCHTVSRSQFLHLDLTMAA